ncbi:MAG: type II toxin-antitoxin system ParD family antitoxin [Dehalococcoidia bacterium]
MNISLSAEQEKLINRLVESGLYRSPEEAIDAAVRLLDERTRKLEALRNDIQEGFDSGPYLPGEQVMEELLRKAEQQTPND